MVEPLMYALYTYITYWVYIYIYIYKVNYIRQHYLFYSNIGLHVSTHQSVIFRSKYVVLCFNKKGSAEVYN